MLSDKSKPGSFGWVAPLCAIATAGLVLLMLGSMLLGWDQLARFGVQTIPMAPATGLAFLGLSGAILIRRQWPTQRWSGILAQGLTMIIAAWGVLVTALAASGVNRVPEQWFVNNLRTFQGMPVGVMSPVTGLLLGLLAASVLAWLRPELERWATNDVSASFAAGVLGVGCVFVAGWGLGTPILYGRWIIPVSLPAALAFILLGIGMLAMTLPGVQFKHRRLPLALAPGTGIVLAFSFFMVVERLERSQIQSQFDQRVSSWNTGLGHNLEASLESLDDMESLFMVQGEVTRNEFQLYGTRLLEQHQGLQAIEWLPRVAASEREKYETAARHEGFFSFQITEWDGQRNPVRARSRPEYFPIYYVEPYQGNEKALGFDPSSEPVRRKGLELSCDTAEKHVSGRINLVQHNGEQYGVVVTLPVYRIDAPQRTRAERRANLRGYISGVFRVDKLIENAAQRLHNEGIDFRLTDITDSEEGALLFASSTTSVGVVNGLRLTKTLPVGGRRWQIEFVTTSTYLAQQKIWQAWTVLFAGLLITGLTGAHQFGTARHIAERERLIKELQNALTEVKTLKGFIPICASCKKIRDDRGFWNQIESYIQQHSDAKFSHGLCPDCANKYFPA